MTNKPYRIRVRALDGKPRDQKALNQLKSNQLNMPHLDIVPTDVAAEFIIAATAEKHIEQVRGKLSDVGLEEIPGGDTTLPVRAGSPSNPQPQKGSPHSEENALDAPNTPSLPKKPYAFVSLPAQFTTDTPVWHDGSSSLGRLSGEVRFELETLTPLLVGWERGQVGDNESEWPVPQNLDGVGQLVANKSVLCPLRAPWGKRPVTIPGDSLKGLLRHELGALLGAPMERVAERSYSYRPNLLYPKNNQDRFLEPRIARVLKVSQRQINGKALNVPEEVELYHLAEINRQTYYPKRDRKTGRSITPSQQAKPYKGGLGGGQPLPKEILSEEAQRKEIRTHLELRKVSVDRRSVRIPPEVIEQYVKTLEHLLDTDKGHFSARHPYIGMYQEKQNLAKQAIKQAIQNVFQPGDLICVEWDTQKQCIVSFGWHYYYRWAYVDTVRRDADAPNGERHGLFPLPEERQQDEEGAPKGLSAVRRLFGYTGDNDGSAGIGKDDYEQLMGRVSINAALEVVGDAETDEQRFLPPTFLKELGMPRPSAVEFYLKQPYYSNARPSDQAKLVTYGDAAGYDAPGELAGRKFYLDRPDAYTGEPWKDDSEANRANERSTLALEASRPGRKFRFTLRFRDLDPHELAAILAALCPHQFCGVLGGGHPDDYCSKLGYARPLGWGSVRIEAKALLYLNSADSAPELKPEPNISGWVQQHYHYPPTKIQAEWLAMHRCKQPDAADYPRENREIYTFHTNLRAKHSRLRRYKH